MEIAELQRLDQALRFLEPPPHASAEQREVLQRFNGGVRELRQSLLWARDTVVRGAPLPAGVAEEIRAAADHLLRWRDQLAAELGPAGDPGRP